MKTISGKVKLEFRNGIELIIPEDYSFELEKEEKYAYFYSSDLEKHESSFDEIVKISRGNEIVIKLDNRIAGQINEGDLVNLIISKIPPKAEIIHLSLSEQSSIPQGDWSKIILESNLGKVVDYGKKISFTIPSEVSESYVLEGQVTMALPLPPAVIDKKTRINIVKLNQVELDKALNDSFIKKQERAGDLEKSVEKEYFDELMKLKNDALESMGRSMSFTAKPKLVFESVKAILRSYEKVKENIILDTEIGFVANILSIAGKKKDIVEITVSGREFDGMITIWVFGKNKSKISNLMKKELIPKLNQQIEGVKEGPELIPMHCAGKCGEMLKLENMEENGIIICPACDTINSIPSRLRIH